jgi:hypothetical protein
MQGRKVLEENITGLQGVFSDVVSLHLFRAGGLQFVSTKY